MRTMMRTGLGAAMISALSLLGSGMASAQDADLQAQVEDIARQYGEAVTAGDYEAVVSLYVENPIYSPISGGIIEDREGIRSFYEQAGLQALEARSSKTEMLGDNLVLDIGTFTATLPEEAGGTAVEGEYVLVAEVGENGLKIRSLTSFPARQAPDAADQQ